MRVNGRFIVKALIYALIFIIFTVFETNIFNSLKIFGMKPNFIISLVVAASIFENEKYASVLGFICGFITDSVFSSPFFFSGVYYFFAAYLIYFIARLYFKKSLVTMMIMILPACAVREMFNLFFLIGTWRVFSISAVVKDYILPEYIYTVAVAPLVYFAVKLTAGRINYGNL